MVMIIIFVIELIIVLLLHKKCSRMYPGISELDENEFKLKKLLPIGLFIVQDVIKYRFDKPRDAAVQGKMAQLYGARNAGTYMKLNLANQICIGIMGIMLATFLSGAVMLNAGFEGEPKDSVIVKNNKIERPALGEGTKEVPLKAEFSVGEYEGEGLYNIEVAEQIPGDEECVEAVLDILQTAILEENSEIGKIKGNLKLPTQSNKYGTEMEWKSDNPAVIETDGSVERPKEREKNIVVTLTATVSKGEFTKNREYKATVLAVAPLTDEQKLTAAMEGAEASLAAAGSNTRAKEVALPKKIKGVTIDWSKVEEEASNAIPIFAFSLLVTLLIILLNGRRLDESIKARKETMQIDYPEFLNKLVILLTSGMNMQKALDKIAADYLAGSEKTGECKPLYEELALAVSEINGGKVFSEAMNSFALRCKTREILKFVSIVELNVKKGSGELIMTLKVQSNEAWESRKAIAKRRGEEASTKLLLPMSIMLLAILIIVITPAALSISGL